MKSIYDEYSPRNEREMCELFETLLFMKLGNDMPGELGRKDLKKEKTLKLSDKELEDLSNIGIINRIFRRWFQTTWGYENVSNHFEGETPRQELARLYPGINQGKDYFSVNLEKQNGEWKIKPYYYPENFLKREGGLFIYGLKRLEAVRDNKIGEPFFDVEFRELVDWLNFGGQAIKSALKDDEEFENIFFEYWDLFLRMAPTNIVLNLKIRKLNEEEFSDICLAIKECLTDCFSSQPANGDNYLNFDEMFFNLWRIIQQFDNDLLEHEELITIIKNETERFKKDYKIKKSVECFNALGILLDRYVFFPIERYFGGAEMVWTDKQVFLNDLYITIQSLKDNIDKATVNNREEDVLDTIYPTDLRYMWFVPCTAFRLNGAILKYFR